MTRTTRGNHQTKVESVESSCLICTRSVRTNDYAVQCEKCDGWMHCGCANISLTLYKCLIQTKSTAIHIDCSRCRPTESKVTPTQSENSEGSESEYESLPVDLDSTCIHVTPVSVSTEVKPVSTLQLNNQSSPKSYAEAVGSGSPTVAHQPPLPTLGEKDKKKHVRPRVMDLMIRIRNLEESLLRGCKQEGNGRKIEPRQMAPERTKCLVLFNAPESEDLDSKNRIEHDRRLLEDMVSKLFDVGERGITIVSAFRLGKKTAEPHGRPRPLKVVLDSENDCFRVFSRTFRLKSEIYRVARDLCPEDRARMKAAVLELKNRRAAGELDLMIQDFRVTRRPPRVGWKPITIQPLGPPRG